MAALICGACGGKASVMTPKFMVCLADSGVNLSRGPGLEGSKQCGLKNIDIQYLTDINWMFNIVTDALLIKLEDGKKS